MSRAIAADVPASMTLITRGEGVECRFFGNRGVIPPSAINKYWVMTDWAEIA